MKISTAAIIALLIGCCTVLFANESIDAQVENILKATPEERPQLMNQFKIRLSNMNAQDRADAISQMRQGMQGTNAKMVQERIKDGEGEQGQMQTRTKQHERQMRQTDQMNQMNQMQQINRMQQKNQGQIFDQKQGGGNQQHPGTGQQGGGNQQHPGTGQSQSQNQQNQGKMIQSSHK